MIPVRGGGGKVGGHACGRTAEEAERRLRHASVPDRQELRHPALALCNEHGHRVGPARSNFPVPVTAAGHFLTQRPPGSDPVGAIDGSGAAQHARGLGGTSRLFERSGTCPP
jgi:hypothetical protein